MQRIYEYGGIQNIIQHIDPLRRSGTRDIRDIPNSDLTNKHVHGNTTAVRFPQTTRGNHCSFILRSDAYTR